MARPAKLKTTTSLTPADEHLLSNEDAQGSAETSRDYIVRLGSTIRNNEARAKQCHRLSMIAFIKAAEDGDIKVSEEDSAAFDTLWKDWKWGPGNHLELDLSTRSELARYRTAAIAGVVAKTNKAPSVTSIADRVRETFNAVKEEAKKAKKEDRVAPIQYERALSKIATYIKDNKGVVSDAKIREIVRGDDLRVEAAKKEAAKPAAPAVNPVVAMAEKLLDDIKSLLNYEATPADLKVALREARNDVENMIDPLRAKPAQKEGDGASPAA